MKLHSISFAALVALALVACGGGGSRVITPTQPPPVVEPPPPPPPPPVTPPTLTIKTIMAFGDSLTEGESTGQLLVPAMHNPTTPGVATSYQFKLDATLKSIYTAQVNEIKVLNFGVGGESAVGSAAKDRLQSSLAAQKPDIVLLLHGVNNVNNPETSMQVIFDAIEELIEEANKLGVKQVFVANLPPQNPTTKARAGRRILEFNAWLPGVAVEENAILVDIHSGINTQTMLMPDGLHLNETGNAKVAELFYAAIKAKYHQEPAQ